MHNETITVDEYINEHIMNIDHLEEIIKMFEDSVYDFDGKITKDIGKAITLSTVAKEFVFKLKYSAKVLDRYCAYAQTHGLRDITMTKYIDSATLCKLSSTPPKNGDDDVMKGLMSYLEEMAIDRGQQSEPRSRA